MNVNATNRNVRGTWPMQNTRNTRKPIDNNKINSLAKEVEKEEIDLKKLNKEFSKHLSNGEQDMAKVKSVAIQQKQLQVQSMQQQIDQLKNPEQGIDAADISAPISSHTDEAMAGNANINNKNNTGIIVDLSNHVKSWLDRKNEG